MASMFRNLRIGSRLLLIVAAGVVAVVVVAALELSAIRENLMKDRKIQLQSVVENAHAVLGYYEGLAKAGKLSKEDAQTAAKAVVGAMRYQGNEYFFIWDSAGVTLMHPLRPGDVGKASTETKDKNGKYFIRDLISTVAASGEGSVEYVWPRPGSEVPAPKISYGKRFAPWNWVVVSGIYVDDVEAIYRQNLLYTAGCVLTALIAVLALSLVISRAITRPLGHVAANMLKLAQGDGKIDIAYTDQTNEIGDLGRALDIFHKNTIEMERLRNEQETLKKAAEEERHRTALALAGEFEKGVLGMVDAVSSAATEMRASAESLSGLSDDVSVRSNAVAAATEQASSNVQTVAVAAEELGASIGEIGRQVGRASGVAGEAVDAVGVSNQKVQGLANAVNKIGEVVNLITDIADQTNLLALNATIEAARAGDAGKGFAVVASEVKNLANQTARATEEIGAQIGAVQAATGEAVGAIEKIGIIIGEISTTTTAISAAVEEQAAATQEISRNVRQAADGTSEVATNVVEVNRATGEAGQAAKTMLTASGSLTETAAKLRRDVNAFLAQIRDDSAGKAA